MFTNVYFINQWVIIIIIISSSSSSIFQLPAESV